MSACSLGKFAQVRFDGNLIVGSHIPFHEKALRYGTLNLAISIMELFQSSREINPTNKSSKFIQVYPSYTPVLCRTSYMPAILYSIL